MDQAQQTRNIHEHFNPSNFEEDEEAHALAELGFDNYEMMMPQNDDIGSTSPSMSSIFSRSNKAFNDYSNNGGVFPEEEQQNNYHRRRLFQTPRLSVIVNGSIAVKPFPLLLYDALYKADPAITRIQWTHNGAAFKIIKDDDDDSNGSNCNNNVLREQLEKTLARFSLPNEISKFKRLLWEFGWRKAVRGRYKDSFFHPIFTRYADLVDISNIQRNYQNRTILTAELATTKVEACSEGSNSISSSSSMVSCSRKRKIESIPTIVSFVTPSPPKRRVIDQNISPNILMSPIAMELAPSRRSLIPVSPICFFEEIYDRQKATATATTNAPRTVATTHGENSDVEENSIDDEEDEDDVSDMSVPMTPLSINIYEEFDPLAGRI